MKIGVLTFSDFNTNYGSMLQAFSLKLYLESNGHNVVFIRYREYHPEVFNIDFLAVKKILIKSVQAIYKFYHRKDLYKTIENFEKFKRENFEYTSLYLSNEELSNMKEHFDAIICGSDQLWNLQCLGGLRTPYFLKFVPNNVKRIFYAVSMGDYHFSSEDKENIIPLLKGCDFISIRESENLQEVQEMTNANVCNVVDPVFLTSSEQWGDLAQENLINGDYGVCYFVRRSFWGKKIVKILLDKYRIPIINLSDNMIYIPGCKHDFISVGPIGFISLIKNAKFVVGTSFHLTAFSIIFRVPAIICGLDSNRSRIMNILGPLGLANHFVTPSSNLAVLDHFINDRIDTTLMKEKIDFSKKFLNDALLNEN